MRPPAAPAFPRTQAPTPTCLETLPRSLSRLAPPFATHPTISRSLDAMDTHVRELVNPDPFRNGWMLVVFVTVLYVMVEIPVVYAFSVPVFPWVLFDATAVCVFSLDIVVSFQQSYMTEEDEWVTDPALIRRHYLRTWFVPDLLAALPLDFLSYAADPTNTNATVAFQVLRLLKTLRLLRVAKLLDQVQVKGLPAWMQLWYMMLSFFLVVHWCACGFWAIAVREGLQNSWAAAAGITDLPPAQQYLWSFYWALATCTTLGYGDIHPVSTIEVLFGTLVIALGAMVYAIVIGAVGAHVISTRFAAKIDYSRFMDSVEALEKHYKLPVPLRKRIHGFYEHMWRRHMSFVDQALIANLPHELKGAVSVSVFGKLLDQSSALKHTSAAFQRALVSMFTWHSVLVPGTSLVERGHVVDRVYFVRRGVLEVLRVEGAYGARERDELEHGRGGMGAGAGEELVVGTRVEGQHCGEELCAGADRVPVRGMRRERRKGGSGAEQADVDEDEDEDEDEHPDVEVGLHPDVAEYTLLVTEHSEVFSVPLAAFRDLLESFPRERDLFCGIARKRRAAMRALAASRAGGMRGLEWAAAWTAATSKRSDDDVVDGVARELPAPPTPLTDGVTASSRSLDAHHSDLFAVDGDDAFTAGTAAPAWGRHVGPIDMEARVQTWKDRAVTHAHRYCCEESACGRSASSRRVEPEDAEEARLDDAFSTASSVTTAAGGGATASARDAAVLWGWTAQGHVRLRDPWVRLRAAPPRFEAFPRQPTYVIAGATSASPAGPPPSHLPTNTRRCAFSIDAAEDGNRPATPAPQQVVVVGAAEDGEVQRALAREVAKLQAAVDRLERAVVGHAAAAGRGGEKEL